MVNANDRRADRPTGIGRPCLFSSAALAPGLRNGFKNAIWLRAAQPRTHTSESWLFRNPDGRRREGCTNNK